MGCVVRLLGRIRSLVGMVTVMYAIWLLRERLDIERLHF